MRLWAACVVLLASVVGVLAVGAGYAEDENAGVKCSEATLHGTYLFAYDGVDVKGKDQGPFAAAGHDVFDGNGKIDSVFSINGNGQVTRKGHLSGTYTVKADCTGTLFEEFDLFIAPDGSKFTLVQIKPPEQVTSGFELLGTAKRVDENANNEEAAGAKCSEATLHGTYLFGHDGFVVKETKKGLPRGPYAIAGYDKYDGNGNVDAVSSFNFKGIITDHFIKSFGTYTVRADCTGTTTFAKDGTQYDLFIAPDGSMFTFVETKPPELVAAGFELQGTAKRGGD